MRGYRDGVHPPFEHPLAGTEAVAYAAVMAQRFVVVSDNGESWVLGGDPDDGELVWAAACAVCHGSEAEGGLGPPLTGDDAVDPFTLADYVRQGSAFDSPDTWMPHFRADRLSAQQLADLMARWAE